MGRGSIGVVRVGLAGTILLALAGCGGDSPAPPMVVITPQPVRGVIASTSFAGFESDVWVSIPFDLSQRGVLDITVDWTYPSTWMFVFLGRTACSYTQLASRTCPFLIASETQTPKPRVLYTETLEPGTYYLILYNVPRDPRTGTGSDNTESVSIQMGLTVSPNGQRASDVIRLRGPVVVSPPRL